MDETREVNVGNKVAKPIHPSKDLKKPENIIIQTRAEPLKIGSA